MRHQPLSRPHDKIAEENRMAKPNKDSDRKHRRRGSQPCEWSLLADGANDSRQSSSNISSDAFNENNEESREDDALIAFAVAALDGPACGGSCNRVCRPAHRRNSETFRYCVYLVLMLTAFLIGLSLGQNRDQVNATRQKSHQRVNFHETDENTTLPSVVLVVGASGFIGLHTALRLDSMGSKVIALDNMHDNLYSSELKEERANLLQQRNIELVRGDACNQNLVQQTVVNHDVDGIIYLASQSGKRDDGAVQRPFHYPMDNMDCFVSILDVLRTMKDRTMPLVYASDSSGYKFSATAPNVMARDEVVDPSEEEGALRYNEMIARAYYKLYGISSVGLRFGTIVGPWGRPDMMYYHNANLMSKGESINMDKTSRRYSHVNNVALRIVHELGTMVNGFKYMHIKSDDGMTTVDALEDFSKWYRETKAEHYAVTSSRLPAHPAPSSEATDICFVTSLFSDNPNLIEREGPYSIANYTNKHPSLKYYYFTNVHDLLSNGWEIVVMDDMDKSFQRFITQSRWPKFMGFRHQKLQDCKTIIYSDANRPPKDLATNIWKDLAKRVGDCPSGIMQDRRPSKEAIFQEMHSVVARKKDTAANIDITKKWFLDQDDFHNDVAGWWNMALIFDPSNPRLQELFTTLWAHYSNEEGSWRDQPMYRYLVDKLDIQPWPLGDKHGSHHSKFFHRIQSSGKHHHYDDAGDINKRWGISGFPVILVFRRSFLTLFSREAPCNPIM